MDSTYVVGIDVGGQTSKIGVVDARGTVLAQTVIRTDTYAEIEPYIAELAEAVKKVIRESGTEGKVRGIGVGAPNGNYYTGTIENAPNLRWGHHKVEFSKLLSEAMDGLPVALTNDANAAAVGEMTYGAARGMKNFIMITLGTGVGSGIVINGEVVYGHDGFAGELFGSFQLGDGAGFLLAAAGADALLFAFGFGSGFLGDGPLAVAVAGSGQLGLLDHGALTDGALCALGQAGLGAGGVNSGQVNLLVSSVIGLVAADALMPVVGTIGLPFLTKDTLCLVSLGAASTFVPVTGCIGCVLIGK